MNKELVRSKEEYESFVHSYTGLISEHGTVESSFWSEPEKYPCVVLWRIEYNSNGPDILDGDFVYLDDFEEIYVEDSDERP